MTNRDPALRDLGTPERRAQVVAGLGIDPANKGWQRTHLTDQPDRASASYAVAEQLFEWAVVYTVAGRIQPTEEAAADEAGEQS